MDEAGRKAILEAAARGGVVGSGGAGFPTAAKLDARVDTVIANGAECEPLLGCDAAAMEAFLGELVEGMEAALDATGAGQGRIAVKAKHLALCAEIEKALTSNPRISLFRLGNFYPAGDEVILIEAVTGRVVPEGGLPKDVGVVVQNVTTLINLARARRGIPVTSRLVTIAGEVASPRTMNVPIGTPVSFLIEAAGGPTVEDFVLVLGGPMMGKVSRDLETPVTKTLGGVLVLPRDHRVAQAKMADPARAAARARSACCQCNFCTELCPRYLVGHGLKPHVMMRSLASASAEGLPSTMAYLCSECGLCGMYACAQGLTPFSVNIEAKRVLREAKIAPDRHERPDSARASLPDRRTPTDRLMARIDVARYAPARRDGIAASGEEGHFPVELDLARPGRLVIPLKQHVGPPCEPLVSAGDRVAAGQAIGRQKPGALGADIHAPLAGIVLSVGEAISIAVDA